MTYRPKYGDWMDHAACRGSDPSIFFPVTPEGKATKTDKSTKPARDICAKCPVMLQCLRFAIDLKRRSYRGDSEFFGVWGGMTL